MNIRDRLKTSYERYILLRESIGTVKDAIKRINREISSLNRDLTTDREVFEYGHLYGEFTDQSDSWYANRYFRAQKRNDCLHLFEKALKLRDGGLISKRLFRELEEDYNYFDLLVNNYAGFIRGKNQRSLDP